VSLSFSADGKTIIAQGGEPEWYLLVWLWEKAKVVATSKISGAPGTRIYQVRAWRRRPGRLAPPAPCPRRAPLTPPGAPLSPPPPRAQCSCSPSSESTVASVVGQGVFRTLRLVDGSLKALPSGLTRRDAPLPAATCTAWLPEGGEGSKPGERDRQLLGTEQGEVLLLEVRPRG
jgi:hypothetical protein